MKRFLKEDSGAALGFALITLLVLSILGSVFLNISLAEGKFAIHHEDKLQAYYIARSGAQSIAEYMLKDPGNAVNFVGLESEPNYQIAGGTFKVSVQPVSGNPNLIDVISVGTFNKIEQTAKIQVSKSASGIGGVFQHAAFGIDGVSVSSNGNKLVIDGSAASKNGTVVLDKGTATSTLVDSSLTYPPIVVPSSFFAEHTTINTAVTFNSVSGAPRNIKVGSINLSNNSIKVTGNGIIHMYVNGDINMATKSGFDVASGAKIYVYVTGARTITFSGRGSDKNVYIYAPDSTFTYQNAQTHGVFHGGILAKTIKLTNQITIKYNADMIDGIALDTSGSGVTYTGYSWVD